MDHSLPKGGNYSEHTASAPREDARRCGMGCVFVLGKFTSWPWSIILKIWFKIKWLQEYRIFQNIDQNKVISIKIQGRQTSLRPQLTWYCSQIVVGRGGDCCCRPPLHNPPTDRSATRANRDARTQHTSIFFVPCLPPPSGECGAEAYFEFWSKYFAK